MINIKVGDLVVSESGVEGILRNKGFVLLGGEHKHVFSIEGKSKSTSLLNEIYSVTGRVYLKKDVEYIRSFKHMIGVVGTVCGIPSVVKSVSYDRSALIHSMGIQLFCDEDNNLLTYKEYMRLYYPEYEFIWKEQLSE